ncbi:MAG: hypothetical protein HYY31_04030 [Chloroflexi bacterium]|nr:hypothetical protein [Chloroflexota bacterium]
MILASFAPEALERLQGHLSVAYEPWVETKRLWDPRELAGRVLVEGIQVVVIEADFLFGEVFSEGSPLRFVGICRSALNQVDVEAATRSRVLVVNTPGRNAQAVAELTLGLMFALARRIPEADAYTKSGHWEDPVEPYVTLRGVELSGKTLGIVGLGGIGKRVARLAKAVGMHVLACDPYVSSSRGVTMCSLEELLKQSDVVSLHAPDTLELQRLLDAPRLALMKPSAYLVNTASASLVDTEALVVCLEQRRLAGAALDVFETSPLPSGSPLLRLDNVVLTPHIGGATDATVERYSRMMVEDILRFVQGRRPQRLVNGLVWRKARA